MSIADNIFIQNCKDILENGVWDTDREVRPRWEDGSPAHTVKKFGIVNRYDLQEEFPILTVRKQYFKSALDELLWIWQKKSNDVRKLGSHIWDQWADEKGTIGKAYGYQLGTKHRVKGIDLDKAVELFGYDGVVEDKRISGWWNNAKDTVAYNYADKHVVLLNDGCVWMDQVDHILYDLKFNPASRRILSMLWNPDEAVDMGLEPCAYSMTFNVSGNKLNTILNQRSQDMLTANGWNVMQYAALTMMMAQVSGLEPGEFVHVIADCHIYDRHVEVIQEIIQNEPLPAPKVELDKSITNFYDFTKDSFTITGYNGYAIDASRIPVAA